MRPLIVHSSAPPGPLPRREKTKPKRALVEARRTSIGSGKVAPKPTPAPLIAAIIGFVQRNIRSAISPPLSRGTPPGGVSSVPRSSAARKTSKPWDRSNPAQKARPAPVTTAARISSSPSTRSQTWSSSRSIVGSSALSCSGRLRVIVAIASETSNSMVVNDRLWGGGDNPLPVSFRGPDRRNCRLRQLFARAPHELVGETPEEAEMSTIEEARVRVASESAAVADAVAWRREEDGALIASCAECGHELGPADRDPKL